MKASSKLFGMVALSAALAFGCAVPAFAVDEYGTAIGEATPTDVEQGSSVATDVKVATRITNINVAVPLTVTVVADSASGDVLVPSAGLKHYVDGQFNPGGTTGYRIENYSPFPVKIADIATKDISNGDWKLVNTTVVGQEATARVGDLNLTLAPSQLNDDKSGANQVTKNEGNMNTATGVTPIDLSSVLIAADADKSDTDPAWIINRKASDTEPAIMGLLLSGTSSILANVNEGSILLGDDDNPVENDPVEADSAFQIIYTVSATNLSA